MPDGLMGEIVICVLALFLGFEVVTKVPHSLHTPLMSGSNAISGITVIGAMVVAGGGYSQLGTVLGIVAVAFAATNIVGGFMVTDRMLRMFNKNRSDRRK